MNENPYPQLRAGDIVLFQSPLGRITSKGSPYAQYENERVQVTWASPPLPTGLNMVGFRSLDGSDREDECYQLRLHPIKPLKIIIRRKNNVT